MIDASFSIFGSLTVMCSVAFLWRWVSTPIADTTPLANRPSLLQAVAARPTASPDVKAVADAVTAGLGALSDFGVKIDRLGPMAIFAVLIVLFGFLTFGRTWLPKHP